MLDGVGPFRGEEVFELPAEGVTYVYAPNGHGKTATIDLVRWLIRGPAAIEKQEFRSLRQDREKSVINNHRFRNMKGGRAEAILHVHGRARYRVTREIAFGTDPSSELTVEEEQDGTWVPVSQPQVFLSRLLPHERLGFNLLTGEHIQEFVEELSGPVVKRSVERLLQDPELVSLQDALDRVTAELEKEADAEARSERRRLKLLEKRAELKEKHESFTQQVKERENEEAKVQTRIETLNQELARLDKAEDLEAERGEQEDALTRLEERQARELQAIAGVLTPSWRDLLKAAGAEPTKALLTQHEQATAEAAAWERAQGEADHIQRLLEDDTCICGDHLEEGTREQLEDRLEALAMKKPEIPTLPADAWTMQTWAQDGTLDGLSDQLARHRERLDEIGEDIAARQARLEEIEDQLEAIGPDEVRRVTRSLKSDKMKIASIRDEKRKLVRHQLDAQEELNTVKQKLADTDFKAQDGTMLGKATRYRKAFREVIDRALPVLREKLVERTQAIFDRLFHKESDFEIIIREQSMVPSVIRTVDGEEENVVLSEGETTRVGIALLFALRQVASERPFLLLDAPFSTLDDEGIHRLLELIASQEEQVVVFTKNAFPQGRWFDAVAAANPTVYRMDWSKASPTDREGFTEVSETDVDDLCLQGAPS